MLSVEVDEFRQLLRLKVQAEDSHGANIRIISLLVIQLAHNADLHALHRLVRGV